MKKICLLICVILFSACAGYKVISNYDKFNGSSTNYMGKNWLDISPSFGRELSFGLHQKIREDGTDLVRGVVYYYGPKWLFIKEGYSLIFFFR